MPHLIRVPGFQLKGIVDLLYPEFIKDQRNVPKTLTREHELFFREALKAYLNRKPKAVRVICLDYLNEDIADLLELKKNEKVLVRLRRMVANYK